MKANLLTHLFIKILVFNLILLLTPIGKLQAATTFTVNSTNDGPDSNTGDDLCNDGSGNCTLRAAIEQANVTSGTDTINFGIGSGAQTISPNSALPSITGTANIDGTTQPGFTGAPLIELDGTNAGSSANGLTVSANDSDVKSLVINRFSSGNGIQLDGSDGTVTGCRIGTNAAGTAAQANSLGLLLVGPNNRIGGTSAGEGNLVSGNSGFGILISGLGDGNHVEGNFIGTDITGMAAIPNNIGLALTGSASDNFIGGTVAGAGNVISGNASTNVEIRFPSSGNFVQGNFLGVDITGNATLGNINTTTVIASLSIDGAQSNQIGGVTASDRNIIGGSRRGVELRSGAGNNILQGNFVGVGGDGLTSVGNLNQGVAIYCSGSFSTEPGVQNNLIGGMSAGEGNVIANNGAAGVAIWGNPACGNGQLNIGNAILGNSIFNNGTSAALGIDLAIINAFNSEDGITSNDAGDPDSGPNTLQNFPMLSSAVSANGVTTIQGNLDSTGGSFRLEFFSNDTCDPSGNGEGQTFLGSADTPSGDFTAVLPMTLSTQLVITATATSATNDTSEFSTCFTATVLVENCTNGTDDDQDNLVDCADPDCAANPDCAAAGVELCNNTLDDDGDGLVHCDDPDCVTDPACGNEICDNIFDDDGDGLVDCSDPDCAADPQCVSIGGGGCKVGTPLSPTSDLSLLFWLFALAAGLWLRRRIQKI